MRHVRLARFMPVAKIVLALLIALAPSQHAHASPATTRAPPLEVIVLGSGGPGATGRAGAAYLVLVDGVARFLVDAGPGSFARLGEAHASLADVDTVLLTHLHVDHAGELAGIFKARAVSSRGPITFDVWGPSGAPGDTRGDAYFPSTSEFLDKLFGARGAFAYLRDFAAPLTLHAHDVTAPVAHAQPRQLITRGDVTVTAIAGHHGDAPALIYRVEHGGKSVTFSGDIDAQGLPSLRALAKATDLLIFNCVVLDPPGSPEILYTLHSPPRAIGQLAHETGARSLVLSHLVPSTDGNREAVVASIKRSYAGPIAFAEDGMRLTP